MSDSDDSMDENIEEVEVEEEPMKEEQQDRSKLPKHMKQRYWNSWEELRLMELWRLHFNEVTDLEQNLPVFRTIGASLRESGYHMYAQDIRRKMRTMKNRYIQESRRIREEGGESEWRLYRLMHCMMSPKRPNCDLNYEKKILAAVMAKNETEPLFHIFASGLPVNDTLNRLENGEKFEIPKPKEFRLCFPLENKMIAASIILAYTDMQRLSFTPRVSRHMEEINEQNKRFEKILDALSRRPRAKPKTPTPLALPLPSTPPLSPKSAMISMDVDLKSKQDKLKLRHQRTRFFNGRGILKNKVNESALERIRAENRELMEQVVISHKKLKQEEQQLRSYELRMAEVKSFHEKFFEKLGISN